MMNPKLVNILFVSAAIFFIYFADNTCGAIQARIRKLEKIRYASRVITDVAGLVTCWLAAPLVAVVGTKLTLIAGAAMILIFIGFYFGPVQWLLSTIHATLTVGSTLVFITLGNYIARNCDDGDIKSATRNSAILLTAQQAGFLISEILYYFKYLNMKKLTDADRNAILGVLIFFCLLGLIMLLFLRLPSSNQSIDQSELKICPRIFVAVKDNFNLLLELDMILMIVVFIYSGLVWCFYTNIYLRALKNSKTMEPTEAPTMHELFARSGAILGFLPFAALTNFTIRWSRAIFVYIAGFFYLVTWVLILLNIPYSATLGKTNESSIINPPNGVVAMTCCFLYGLATSFFNVPIYSMLVGSFTSESTAAFAIYKFFMYLTYTLSYFFLKSVSLYIHIVILIVALIGALSCFAIVERGPRGQDNSKAGTKH